MKSENNAYLQQLQQIVLDYLAGYKIKVYLIGSHAKGLARKTSDVDIALLPLEFLEPEVIANLRELLEESTIPYKVDIIDLSNVDYEFRDKVLTGAILWQG